jgi:hypothetical protein
MHEPPDVGRWLLLLRDGTEHEQQLARTELGLILEARGLLDDAAEAYARNVADGVRDRRPYERLAALARRRGDVTAEAATLRALADLLAPPPTTVEPEPPEAAPPPLPEPELPLPAPELPIPAPAPESEPDLALAAATGAELLAPKDAASSVETPPPLTAEEPVDPELAAAAGADLTPPVPTEDLIHPVPSSGGQGGADVAPPGVAPPDVAPTIDEVVLPDRAPPLAEPSDARAAQTPVRAVQTPENGQVQPAGVSRWVLTLSGLVIAAVVVGAALMIPISRPLNVTPSQPAASPAPLGIQLIATAPAIRPSPPPVASPSPAAAMTMSTEAVTTPLAVAASPLPAASPTPAPLAARCADAALRFPESSDTQAAVRGAFREYLARQGVTIDPASTLFAGLSEAYAERHAEVVAGWMAVTLQRERRGLPTFPLVDYVSSDVIAPAGPGEYQLRPTVSPQGWSELRNLPPETCEGAFFASVANARWIELMQASVGDITWALPTPQPRP